MKEAELDEGQMSWWLKCACRLLGVIGVALFETILVVVIASFPMMCIGLFNFVSKGESARLISSVVMFFMHGDGLLLATSLLGTAVINAFDLFGEKNRIWEGVRTAIYIGVFIAYGLVLACECAVEVPHENVKDGSMTIWIQLSFLVTACFILLLSNCWRRRFPLGHGENPYQNSDNKFKDEFGEYVKHDVQGGSND